MMRIRITLVAAVACLPLGLLAGPAAAASTSTSTTAVPNVSTVPALYTVHVTGASKSGKQFKGSYGIQRFTTRNGKAYAVGTLKGTLNGHHVTKYDVMMPASLTGTPSSTSSSSSSASARDAQASCSVLNLVLGPVNLNLLGLVVQLGGGNGVGAPTTPINLKITAVPGAGNLLGNLLCDITNALNQNGVLSQLNGDLSQLTSALNGILSIFGALPASAA